MIVVINRTPGPGPSHLILSLSGASPLSQAVLSRGRLVHLGKCGHESEAGIPGLPCLVSRSPCWGLGGTQSADLGCTRVSTVLKSRQTEPSPGRSGQRVFLARCWACAARAGCGRERAARTHCPGGGRGGLAGRGARGKPQRRLCRGARRALHLGALSPSTTRHLVSGEVAALCEEHGGSEGGSKVRAPRTPVRVPGWDSSGTGSVSIFWKRLCAPGPERCQAQRPPRFTWTLCNWWRRPGVRGRCRPSASPSPLRAARSLETRARRDLHPCSGRRGLPPTLRSPGLRGAHLSSAHLDSDSALISWTWAFRAPLAPAQVGIPPLPTQETR